jgi:DNA-binding transcriptional MerR regulator
MEYSIKALAKLAGISVRTLHYYDEIKLLTPRRIRSNGYRVYGEKEVDSLQQILFYRELGLPLENISQIMHAGDYDGAAALAEHLTSLLAKRDQLDLLIANVQKTILASKGEITMSDKEKFEGIKKNLIDENEKKYGKEVRAAFGDQAMDASNAKFMGLTHGKYAEVQDLSLQINQTLLKAREQGDPAGELAQKVCEMHKKWISFFWKEYSKEAHMGLAQTYVDDPRFRKYYEDIGPGCAEFLRDALMIYCK